jgi:hypothetical protein
MEKLIFEITTGDQILQYQTAVNFVEAVEPIDIEPDIDVFSIVKEELGFTQKIIWGIK